METKHYKVTEDVAGLRLDKALSLLDEDLSRSHIKALIEDAMVTLNTETVKVSQKVSLGDVIDVSIKPPKPLTLTPVNLNLEIVYEDDHLLVVNKPTGLVVHPADTVKEPTLVHGLLHQVTDLGATNDTLRPGIVHRIDKDTSGLLVVAKHEKALKGLQASLKSHKMKREYVALVEGVINHNKGKVDAPIGRNAKHRQKMSVNAGGKASVTHFQVLERFENHTLIACQLETGRTHQIRVHMAYINFPLVGDPKYGHGKTDTTHGQFLHAKSLGFSHPITKKALYFETTLPRYFTERLNVLRG